MAQKMASKPAETFAVALISAPLVFGAVVLPAPGQTSAIRAVQTNDYVSAHGEKGSVRVEMSASQAYYTTPRWREQEAIAMAELKSGEYEEFDTAEDALAWLRATA